MTTNSALRVRLSATQWDKILKVRALIFVGRVDHFTHHLAISHASWISNLIMHDRLYLGPGSSMLQRGKPFRAFQSLQPLLHT